MKRKLRILAVDDSESDTLLIQEILSDAGFKVEVERVETAPEMRDALADGEWDLVFSEHILTNFSGIEALQLLKNSGKDIPCLILSGEIDVDEAMDMLKQGATDCLLKENLSRLISAVEETVKSTEIQRQKAAADRAMRRDAQAFAQINDSVICLDSEGRITSWNKAAQRMRGWTAKEMIGQSMLVMFDPQKQADILQKFADLQHGDEFRGELEELCKDGSRLWVDVRFSCLQDNYGRPAGYMSIARDVTKLRRNHQRIRFQASLLDQLPGAVLVIDLHALVTYWNRGAEKLYGWREAEVVGRDLSHILATPSAEIEAEKIIQETRKHGSWEGEFAATHQDGTEFPIYLITSLLRDQNGEPVGIATVSFDISYQKTTAKQGIVNTHRLNLASEIANVGVWEVTPDFEHHLWNEQMFLIWGLEPEYAPPGAQRWRRYIHEDDLESVDISTARAFREPDEPYDIEFRIRRGNDGAVRNIRALGRIICDSTGKPIRMVGMNLDVTDIRLREKSLMHALSKEKELLSKAKTGEKSKSEFLAVMGHDIRTPLNGIMGFTELLKRYNDLPRECRDYVEAINRSGESLLGILDNIKDYSQLEAHGITLHSSQFCPQRLLSEIEAHLASFIESKKITITVLTQTDVPDLLEGDAGRLRQILQNLAENAVKFTENGTVTIEARKANDPAPNLYEFIVSDTGPGIPADMQTTIFEPFVQVATRISERHEGAGLGLAISRRLVNLMGGTLTVKSEEGIGSVFCIQLPLTPPRRPQIAEASSEIPEDEGFAEQHPMDILVVEDDAINRKLILTLLKKLGYEPRAVSNGIEAVAAYEERPCDLILMDIYMPHMDGYDATKRIREIEAEKDIASTFIAAITANTVPTDRDRCLAFDMNEHLSKPIKRESVLKILLQAYQHIKHPH